LAGPDLDTGSVDPDVRNVQRDLEGVETIEGMGDESAGTDLLSGVNSFVEQEDIASERRVGPQQVQSGGGPGRTGADNNNVKALHSSGSRLKADD